jgi:uncharacterized protein (DUF58 family)
MSQKTINLRAWGYLLLALFTLTLALLSALASQVASSNGQGVTSIVLALISLLLAGIISVTVVPYLARRARSELSRFKVTYKVAREGWIYFAVTILIGLSAVNTGNNLLYIVLSAMLASIVVSGTASHVSLSGLEISFDFPERVFALQPALATISLINKKQWLPSFSVSIEPSVKAAGSIQFRRIYLPIMPGSSLQKQRVELVFRRRGKYSQGTVQVSTRFPFGFIVKSIDIPQPHELIVFPSIGPTDDFFEILPLISGEFESFMKGRGMDLYSLRDYATTDSARVIHWKASARSETVKVKEFSREDERRLVLVFDPMAHENRSPNETSFEAAISLCACLANHFFIEGADLSYLRSDGTMIEGSSEATLDQIFTELALLEMRRGQSRLVEQMESLPQSEKDSFKIVFTMRGRGTLPTPLWQSSHVIFIGEIFSASSNRS